MAQAALAPPNPQQERCIEAVADTKEEKAFQESIGEPPDELSNDEAFAWLAKRAKEAFGSVEAAKAARQKIMRAKYTRQAELLAKNAREGHLPSLDLLAHNSQQEGLRGLAGVPTPEESVAALRTLHDHHFPLAALDLANRCWEALPETPDEWRAQLTGAEKKPPEVVKWLAEVATRREACLDLYREDAFRGNTSAWDALTRDDLMYPPLAPWWDPPPSPQVGIVPLVEHYAWLELNKLVWDHQPWASGRSVPEQEQEDLAKKFMNDEQRREARALAKRYSEVLWPRRIEGGQEAVCRLLPQFAGDPDPYGPDPSPR